MREKKKKKVVSEDEESKLRMGEGATSESMTGLGFNVVTSIARVQRGALKGCDFLGIACSSVLLTYRSQFSGL